MVMAVEPNDPVTVVMRRGRMHDRAVPVVSIVRGCGQGGAEDVDGR